MDGSTVVDRFTIKNNGVFDSDSRKEIIGPITQPFSNHNGGTIDFGPDGYLYIGQGDGGSGGDPEGNGQNLQTLLGSLLRIDVDNGDPYAIPSDNPHVGSSSARPEIFAYGLRNPWRMSWDHTTRTLWIADVGQSMREEIDVLALDDFDQHDLNYGWNCREGTIVYNPNCGNSGPWIEPVHDYPRSEGQSITGGHVYRGSSVPSLAGKYIYGDYGSDNIWAATFTANNGNNWNITFDSVELLENSPGGISSFGIDKTGESYMLKHDIGELSQLQSTGPCSASCPQLELSEASEVDDDTDDRINDLETQLDWVTALLVVVTAMSCVAMTLILVVLGVFLYKFHTLTGAYTNVDDI
eukprot:TRINITY_DN11433_c0_g1_i2.p2 TRINITY_DN11433_c0_g1~~TRINITY_DN11433_c0_g1_i2.p2  ORF type:complete len:354 (+),score=46.85 TRINITY_DN11433_c0_g1_i2:1563-2624(+)